MNEHRWRQVDELFQQSLDHDSRERSQFLRDVAGNDSDLIREVRALLCAHERAAPFLEEPAHGGASRVLGLDTGGGLDDPVGARIGPWRIVRVLAAGGMGAVYHAVRDDDAYHKQVAIKLVRRGLLGSSSARGEELIRRFHIERQALANLDHPCIARLIDGGTTDPPDNRPYLVMEYVDGVPIDVYCRDQNGSIRQRVRMFCSVCEAVQHAHQNLVLHRDLKPANILVTSDGQPKLLDFGLAKLLDHAQAAGDVAHNPDTVTGEFMGTFAYAAPEQLCGSQNAPDTRTDVYALGLILYRLVSGQHAFDVTGPMSDVLRRIANDAPQAPSRLDPKTAANEELDTIILKALAKSPSRRYQSAGDLRADLDRWLLDEPILAKADSGWYVLRKNIQRYRMALAIAGCVGTLVAASAVLSWIQAARLSEQRATLAEALRISNIERGRAMALTGNTATAESLLWREYLEDAKPRPSHADDQLARWALWELYLNQPCLRTLRTDLNSIEALAWTSDNRWAALSNRRGQVLVIDAISGAVTRRFDHGFGYLQSLSFQPATNQLLIAQQDGLVSAWNIESGMQTLTLNAAEASQFPIRRVACSAAGQRVATVTDTRVAVWDLATQARVFETPIPTRLIAALAISPDDRHVAVGGAEGTVWLLDEAGVITASYFPNGRTCGSVAFSPDSRYLAANTSGTRVAIIDVRTRQVHEPIEATNGWIKSLHFDPSCSGPYRLCVAGFDKGVHVWELTTDEPSRRSFAARRIRTFRGHNAPVFNAIFSADGRSILSAGGEPGLRVWEMDEAAGLTRWPQDSTVFDVLCTGDGRMVISAEADGEYRIGIRDSATGDLKQILKGHSGAVASIALNPGGDTLASASYDGTVRTWRLNSSPFGEPMWTSPHREAIINSIAWSPDGQEIAAAADDGRIVIHRAHDGAVSRSIEIDSDRIPSIRFSPDGRYLAAALIPQNRIVLIDRVNGSRNGLSGADQPVRVVRFSPDGRLLASAGDDLVVRLWSMDSATFGDCRATLEGHQQDLFALAFTRDGSMLASAGRSGEIKLWNVHTHRCVATLPSQRDMLFNLTFSPDQRRLVACGRGGALGVWDLSYYDQHIQNNRPFQQWRMTQP